MTYMAGGRQYVVIATGGHNWVYPFKKGDSLIAYALPRERGRPALREDGKSSLSGRVSPSE